MINGLRNKILNIMGSRNILGLAFEEKCLLVADMHYDGENLQVKNTACLMFPEDVSIEKPGEMGELLKQFLKEKDITAKKAVIGIPAKWFMVREKILPPSKSENVPGMVRIHAEREFPIGSEELVIDYTGEVSEEKPGRLSIGAVRRQNYDNVLSAARSAGLNTVSVTPTSLALRMASPDDADNRYPDYFLYFRPGYGEIITGEDVLVTGVKYISGDDAHKADQLVSEIKRVISLKPNREGDSEKGTLMILNASDLDPYNLSELRAMLSSRFDILDGDMSVFKKKTGISSRKKEESLAPAALGMMYTAGGPYCLDFYNSRLDIKTSPIKKRHVTWAGVMLIVLVIFILNMLLTLKSDKNDVLAFKTRLEEMSGDIQSAQDVIRRMTLVSPWYSDRPEILLCLRELTLAFPVEGRVWATNLALNEDMKGIVSGKAVDEKSVIEILDKLKGNNMFSNTQIIHIRENGRSSQEVSFSMSFSFKGGGIQ